MRKLVIAVIIGLTVVSSATARTEPTLNASPNPVVAGQSYELTGCGYSKPDSQVQIRAEIPDGSSGGIVGYAFVDANGCIDTFMQTSLAKGSFTVSVFTVSGRNFKLVAETVETSI